MPSSLVLINDSLSNNHENKQYMTSNCGQVINIQSPYPLDSQPVLVDKLPLNNY